MSYKSSQDPEAPEPHPGGAACTGGADALVGELPVAKRSVRLAAPAINGAEAMRRPRPDRPATSALRTVVIGSGYVGLVTGTCLSELGHDVVCVDTDAAKIRRLGDGHVPIYEPGLEALLSANIARGRLAFTADVDAAVAGGADVVFIAVGTPDGKNGGANLDYVRAAAAEVARAIAASADADGFSVIVTKSTVPVGTSRQIAELVARHLPAGRFAVASNPEFLREGSAIGDFMRPERIVIGTESPRARRRLEELYAPLTERGHPLVATAAIETAELIKYAANAFLATKIAFINDLARLCACTGADVTELARGLGLDRRIGSQFLAPGPGFGGSCFPKDLRALVKVAREAGSPVSIAEAVLDANDRHKQAMVDTVREALGGTAAGRRIAVLGVAFKADTDDMRDAPALTILPPLIAEGAQVNAFDPAAGAQAQALIAGLHLADTAEAALAGADAAVVLTEWDAFRRLDWATLAGTMRFPLLIDLRNMYLPVDINSAGLHYIGLGRPEGRPLQRMAAE